MWNLSRRRKTSFLWTERTSARRKKGSAGKTDLQINTPLWSEMANVWIVFVQLVQFSDIVFKDSFVRKSFMSRYTRIHFYKRWMGQSEKIWSARIPPFPQPRFRMEKKFREMLEVMKQIIWIFICTRKVFKNGVSKIKLMILKKKIIA